VLANWFRRDNSAGGGPYTASENGRVITTRDGTPRTQTSYASVTVPVCDAVTGNGCNGALNTRFENASRPLVRARVYSELDLGAAETEAFGLWALKTSLLLAHPATRYPETDARPDGWNLGVVAIDLYGWMVSGCTPPRSLSPWLSRARATGGRGSQVDRSA
jgi:hypothetical protein